MSFANTLERLRETARGQKGRGGTGIVLKDDLAELLYHCDRLDRKVRCGGNETEKVLRVPVKGTIGERHERD